MNNEIRIGDPAKNLSVPKIPFFVTLMPFIGGIVLVICVLAGIGMFVASGNKPYGDPTPYGMYGIGLIIYGFFFSAVLQALEYAVVLLRRILVELKSKSD